MSINLQTAVIGNRYQLQHVIGSGGMGVVYRAADRLTGQTIALKRVLAPADDATGSSTDSRLALAQEFQILAGLRHPHIISVLDYGFDAEKRPFFTMDYLTEAVTILQAGQQLSVNGRLQLVLQMLQALTYLHRRDVLHNDLKPANILVTNGQVKLLDFGLSATVDKRSSTAGTWAYMAPEIMRGGSGSAASDLFAAGVITYELLAGKRPFQSIADTLTPATPMKH